MGQLPIVRIVDPMNPDAYIVINASDFDPAVHTRFIGEPVPATAKTTTSDATVALLSADDVVKAAQASGLKTDGPTFEEFVAAGYKPEHYPPSGYAELPSPGLDAYRAQPASQPVSDASAMPTSEPTPAPSAAPLEPSPAAPEPATNIIMMNVDGREVARSVVPATARPSSRRR